MSARPLTGRRVALMLLAAFGVIVGANAALVVAATGTFPGLIVENSYVASQHYDARRAALAARGWTVEASLDGEALTLEVRRAGRPVRGLEVTARLGRPASAATDRVLRLEPSGDGYRAPAALAPGRWQAVFEIDDGAGEPVEMAALLDLGG